MDKLEIIRLAEKSILTKQVFCLMKIVVRFFTKHPVINPTLSKCLEYEKRFDYESLISECIK